MDKFSTLKLSKLKRKDFKGTDSAAGEFKGTDDLESKKFKGTDSIEVEDSPLQESFKVKGVKDRLNSIMPIKTNGIGGSALKIKDESVESIKTKAKLFESKSENMKSKTEYLKRLRNSR